MIFVIEDFRMAALSKELVMTEAVVLVVVVVLIVVRREFTGLGTAAPSKTLVVVVGESRVADCSFKFHGVWAITRKSETVFCCNAILEEMYHGYVVSFVEYSVIVN